MSAQHTPGTIRYDYEPGYCGELIASNGGTVATFTDEPSEADARRLVACWNACEGITTERLEEIDKPLLMHLTGADRRAARMVQERRELEAQRDELLAALQGLLMAVQRSVCECSGPAQDAALAVIAKVKGAAA